MYLQYFGLSEPPFSITPDPAFVYLSGSHREALAHLLYGVGQGAAGGFVQLTGEVGTGKTTLCRCLLEQLPEDTRVALILNPLLSPRELLATICEELDVPVDGPPDSTKALVDSLNRFLLREHAAGRRVVVIIDEAQNLSPEALEQVRLLTNLETAKHKLLQMVLLGQPELRQLLQRQNLRQLAQRITARYHLTPLSEDETAAYVRHRMRVAGAQRSPFKRAALQALHRRSGGIPRLINIIADRALAGAYAREASQVTPRLVNAAADEVQPSEARVTRRNWTAWAATAAALALAVVSVITWGPPWLERHGTAFPDGASTESSGQVPAETRESAATGRHAGALAETTPPGGPVDGETPGSDMGDMPGAVPETAVGAALREPAPATVWLPGEELSADWLDRQHDLAFAQLAELWQDAGSADAIRAACAGQQGRGWACLRDSGSWSRLRQLGMPAVLVLQDRGGRHVLLRGLGDDRVLLGVGGDELTVSRSRIEPLWFGEYLVAWPQAPDWPTEIRRGESGAAVEIVLQMAELADPGWEGGEVFDARFEDWLIRFQRRHGLAADGIIGPKTLLYLMAPGVVEPRLVPLES